MSKRSSTVLAALAAFMLGAPALAAGCVDPAKLPGEGVKFARYAVRTGRAARPAPVVLATKDERMFRTALREAQKAGPNFAGRYVIAGWGCGAGCRAFGVIDARAGTVTFDAARRTVEAGEDDWPAYDAATKAYADAGANGQGFDLLLFRADSSLLVMLGAPNEDETRDGVAYLHWTGKSFEQVRFIPAKSLCRKG
jgi:hypothetical protein